MRKLLAVLACLSLLVGIQAGAKMVGLSNSGVHVAVENSRVPEAPETPFDATDDILLFDDFESGQGAWEFVDLTDVSTWHTDSYNAYGASGLSWWVGDPVLVGYDNHWLQYLVSPSLDLSGTTNPTLTFKLFFAIEEPGGEPPPWDGWDGCNVWVSTDGGTNWDVLDMLSPAYTCTSMYSFGYEWGMGPDIAGWGGYSGGSNPGVWVDANTSLVGYQTTDVKIRFAFCSDPAYCTAQNASLIGVFVDNVLIQDGATTYLENNAEGIAYPSDLDPTPPTVVGNFWHMSEPGTPTPPSPTWVMEMSDGAGAYPPGLYNALTSPVIDLTSYTTGEAFADFYIRGTINVNDPDPFPDVDVWTVQVQPQGGGYGWFYYSAPWGVGTDYVISTIPTDYTLWSEIEGNTLDLTPYFGYEVKIRILFSADLDNYSGEGLFVDDFIVEFLDALSNDVGCEKMHVPMPTSLYFSTIPCDVEIHNYGVNNQGQVPTLWRENYGTPQPVVIPWPSVPALSYITEGWDWTTPAAGDYFMDSYTWLISPPDENTANDSSKAGLVEVTAADVLEFGYDNRQYSYEPVYNYFLFDPGEGAYIRYTPQADGVTDPVSISSLRALFYDTGTLRVRIYEEGTASSPGPIVTAFNQTVTVIDPDWQTIDVSGVSYLQNTTNEFWVFYEILDVSQAPHLMGMDELIHGEGHFFADFGSGFGPSDYDFFARAIGAPGTAPNFTVTLTYNYGSPVPAGGGYINFDVFLQNNETSPQSFDLWIEIPPQVTPPSVPNRNLTFPGGFSITRPDMNWPIPAGWPAGNYTMDWYIGDMSTWTAWASDSFPFVKSADDDGSGYTLWEIEGDPLDQLFEGIDFGETAIVSDFAMLGAYPNPFNPSTTISYVLPEASKVTLTVYDINGRQVAELVNGWRAMGVQEAVFDASNLASGVYIYNLTAGTFNATGKMVMMK